MLNDTQEADCLKYNPFEGDFGTPGDRILKDKIVTSRKKGFCVLCLNDTEPGERTRTLAAIFDGHMRSYRWCEKCCEAMALSWTDDGKALERRIP